MLSISYQAYFQRWILPKTCRPISYNLYIKANNKFWKQNQVSHNKEYNRGNLTTEKVWSVKVGGDPQSPVLSFLTGELPLTHPLNDSISSSRFVFFVVVSVGVVIALNIAVTLCNIKTAPSMCYIRRYLILNETLVYLIKDWYFRNPVLSGSTWSTCCTLKYLLHFTVFCKSWQGLQRAGLP